INRPCGITQDPETKNYMMVLNNICKKCKHVCNAIYFQQNFENWTSNDDDIDKFIQDTQLSVHKASEISYALEWIPYDKLNDIKYVTKNEFGEVYRANWIDGNISYWDYKNRNWKREGTNNMFINLMNLSTPKNITIEFMNEIKSKYEFYGITQDPITKNYMMVLNNICKKCKIICYTMYFQHKFIEWTSGNNDIDKFIQNTQLSAHEDTKEALEWIPYDRFNDAKYITKDERGKVYRANWGDVKISYWNNKKQNRKRINCNMLVILKSLNSLENIAIELKNEINECLGITQDPETKNYLIVLTNKCKKCDYICNTMHFQQNFKNWTSNDDDIDKIIQDTQLSAHYKIRGALEWIPYDRFNDIKYIADRKMFRANWIDGKINYWDNKNQNWKRRKCNMLVILKYLNKYHILDHINEIKIDHELYGITQDPKNKNYMMVSDNRCEKYNCTCNNWTSGNNDIDQFIQGTRMSAYDNPLEALGWIPHDKFDDIDYIAKGGFGKVYKANWKRLNDKEMIVALKSLDNSKNVTLEFMNEVILHNKVKMDLFIIGFYGITRDPETGNYMMVLEYAEDGSLRNYLDKCHKDLNLNDMIDYLYDIILGLKYIHNKELIHRDLHNGNILKLKYKVAITDMGLCKPANYNTLKNTKNNIYGVLPYVAPEILRGQDYTKAADIYSFGIIMYELISGLPPYYGLDHDNNLAINICQGLRPRFNIKVPQLIVSLIKKCLDAEPLNRPKAEEINDILRTWRCKPNDNQTVELQAQIKEADEVNNNSSNGRRMSLTMYSGLSYKTHSEAIYTSRLLDFDDLPEPKNSYDYYKQNDNIISVEFSESLQINIP
ncbi:hypothetical protein RclHR1_19480002, partial [Rhizophagus clarus]